MTWPVYVINMKGSSARMESAARELARCGVAFTRFEAVNGRALSPEEMARVYDPQTNARRARHPLIGPEIGCYLSHIALWEQIAAGEAAGGIILEDDFEAADDLAAVLEAVAADDGAWDIAKLFSARKGQKMLNCRPLVPGRQIGVPYKVPNTTLGYAIRREAAARLAKASLPVSRPVDEDHKHFWDLGLRVQLVVPPPLAFGALSREAATITAARRKTRRDPGVSLVQQAWRTLRFRLRYLVLLHWHRLVRRTR